MILVVEILIEIGIQKYANLYMNIQSKKCIRPKKKISLDCFLEKLVSKDFFIVVLSIAWQKKFSSPNLTFLLFVKNVLILNFQNG